MQSAQENLVFEINLTYIKFIHLMRFIVNSDLAKLAF